jgi:hypothetical protein
LPIWYGLKLKIPVKESSSDRLALCLTSWLENHAELSDKHPDLPDYFIYLINSLGKNINYIII